MLSFGLEAQFHYADIISNCDASSSSRLTVPSPAGYCLVLCPPSSRRTKPTRTDQKENTADYMIPNYKKYPTLEKHNVEHTHTHTHRAMSLFI